MGCHHIVLDLIVLITCLGLAMTSHCNCDLSTGGCDNMQTCYNCEFRDYLDTSCLDDHSGVDLDTCRTYLTTGSRKQALYTYSMNECTLISKPDTCTPRFSSTVDIVFLKTCYPGCTNYTIQKHENTMVVGTSTDSKSFTSSNKCQDECFPLLQDCTVSYSSTSQICTIFKTCGISCLSPTVSSDEVYTFTCNPVDCQTLSDPPNGLVNASAGTSSGTLAEYSCNEGYNLTGSSVVSCRSDGQWNDSIPSCTPVDCGIPAALEFGSVLYTDTSYGANATYICGIGYDILGPISRSCLANGSWELPQPICVPLVVSAEKTDLGKLFIMPCICYLNKTFVGLTEEEIIQQLIADTRIVTKKTKLAVNKLISKPDPRFSSKMIGTVSVVVLSIVGGVILCSDILTIRERRRALGD